MDNFEAWMSDVDAELISICGLSSDDLADACDACYRDMFDDGTNPANAAMMALEDEGFEFD